MNIVVPEDALYIGIVGSRDFPELWMVRAFVDALDPARHIIVSGGAVGVDRTAVDHARYRKIQYIEYYPDYERDGRAAPHLRNNRIIAASDVIIAFWDEESRGTYSVIKKAEDKNKLHMVYKAERRERLPTRHRETGDA